MTGNRKRLIYLILGLCAGLLAFSAVELLAASGIKGYLVLALLSGGALGLIFGFTFGFAYGVFYKELKRGLIRGAIAAAAGAGIAAAAVLFTSHGMLWTANIFEMDYELVFGVALPLWRGIGWMIMGAAVGAVDGIHQKAFRRVLAGVLGGVVGGLAGGLGFEFLIRYLPGASAARASGLIIMGVLIGLFIGEFERRFSFARLRVLNGQLKDREFLLVKNRIRIGGEMADDVYLHGYPEVLSGIISRKNGEVRFETGAVEDSNKECVTLLNEEPVDDGRLLKYQDVIRLGDVKLLYLPL